MSVRENLKDRLEASKDLVNFSVTKETWADLKGRFGKDVREPEMGRKYTVPGNGTVGSVAGTLLAIPIALLDKAERFWQEQAKITRRWVK